MDLSELLLKVNKGQAVTQLKSVQTELNKTGSAADKLKDTLKNIGVSIGLAALVKQSLQFNNELTTIEKKFNTIFGGKFNGVKELVNDFNLTNSSATKMLSTIGQFTQGLGFASNASKDLSLGLSKAAADFAAFSGGNAEDIAKKFGKALTGETGELKDLGIYIDTSSESFKKLTAEITASTGAIGAQARALAINKMILEQTSVAAGSSVMLTLDGFTQLKKVFENIKETLAKVGQILSVAFGPILEIFNQILSKPMVQWFAAFTIVVGSLTIAVDKLSAATGALAGSMSVLGTSVASTNSYMADLNKQINRMSNDKVRDLGDGFNVIAEAAKGLENRELRLDTKEIRDKLKTMSQTYNKNTVKPIELPATLKIGELHTDAAKSFAQQLQAISKTSSSVKQNMQQATAFQNTFVTQITKSLNDYREAYTKFLTLKVKGEKLGYDVEALSQSKEFWQMKDDLAKSMNSNGVVDEAVDLVSEYTKARKQLGKIQGDMRQVFADFQYIDLPIENIRFFQSLRGMQDNLSRLNINNIDTFDLSGVTQELELIELLSKDFEGYMGPLEDVKEVLADVQKSVLLSSAVTKKATVAEIALANSRAKSSKVAASVMALDKVKNTTKNLETFTGAINGLKGKLQGVQSFLSGLINIIPSLIKSTIPMFSAASSSSAEMAKALGGLKIASLGSLKAIGGLIASFLSISVYLAGIIAAVTLIGMILEGLLNWDFDSFINGRIATAVQNMLDGLWEGINNFFGGSYKSAATMEKEARELDKFRLKIRELTNEVKKAYKEFDDLNFEIALREALPEEKVKLLSKKIQENLKAYLEIERNLFTFEKKMKGKDPEKRRAFRKCRYIL